MLQFEQWAVPMSPEPPATLSELRKEFLEAHLKRLRDTQRAEEADYLRRILFAPIVDWKDR